MTKAQETAQAYVAANDSARQQRLDKSSPTNFVWMDTDKPAQHSEVWEEMSRVMLLKNEVARDFGEHLRAQHLPFLSDALASKVFANAFDEAVSSFSEFGVDEADKGTEGFWNHVEEMYASYVELVGSAFQEGAASASA